MYSISSNRKASKILDSKVAQKWISTLLRWYQTSHEPSCNTFAQAWWRVTKSKFYLDCELVTWERRRTFIATKHEIPIATTTGIIWQFILNYTREGFFWLETEYSKSSAVCDAHCIPSRSISAYSTLNKTCPRNWVRLRSFSKGIKKYVH